MSAAAIVSSVASSLAFRITVYYPVFVKSRGILIEGSTIGSSPNLNRPMGSHPGFKMFNCIETEIIG